MKKHHRRLSVALSATILLSSFALTAYPLELNSEKISVETVGESSGNMGYNIKWTFSDDGTLSLTGEGAMDSMNSVSSYPWYSFKNNIKKIVIGNGITRIGDYAFCNYNKVEEISVPEGVEAIGDSSLMGLKKVKNITLPTSLKSIGKYGLYNCSSLETVVLPDGVTNIGGFAFEYCTSLVSINIPKSANEIGEGVFAYCKALNSVEVSAENESFEINGNCLFDKENKVLLWGTDESVIPDETVKIGSYAFQNKAGLKEVIIPDTVEIIGEYAFENCSSLEKATLSNALKEIKSSAFYGCKALTEIVLPDSLEIIGDLAFTHCSALAKIETGSNIRYIGGGDGGSPFYNTAVYNDESNWENGALYIGKCLIEIKPDKLPTEYEVKDGTTVIASYVFSGSKKLKSLLLPDSLLGTGKYAFSYCTSLTELKLPASIVRFEEGMFLGCSSLGALELPENLEYIGKFALGECTGLKELNIPSRVSFIDYEAFSYGNGYEKITVSAENQAFQGAGNCLIEKESKTLILGCMNSVIPSDGSVVTIGENAFHCCYGLLSIVIPDSVKAIDTSAFYECSSLVSVDLGKGVETVGDLAFGDCSALEKVTGGENVKNLGASPFIYTLYYNTQENWENNALYLNTFLLEYNGNDTAYEIKAGTTAISHGVFMGKKLENVTIPSSVIGIGDYAFGSISASQIAIPDSVEYIGDNAFVNCSTLKKVSLGSSVKIIGDAAFKNCFALEEINIPNTVEKIGADAFYNCLSLLKLSVPSSVVEIGERAFGIYFDSESNEDEKINHFEIEGIKGTAIEVYAEINGLSFVAVNITTLENNSFFVDKINNVMPNVKEGIAVSEFVSILGENGLSAIATDKDGNALNDNDSVGTGCIIDIDGNKYTVIVRGDVDGSGNVDSTDYLQIKKMFLKELTLENEYLSAADADKSGDISSTDYLQIKNYFLGDFELYK